MASQNEEQAQHNRWSFTRYDFRNRPVMAGVTHQSTAPTPQQLNDTAWPYNWGNNPYLELVGTHWDALPPNAPPGWKPGLLRARIAAVWRDDDGDGEPEHRAWYDYDALGNVKRYLQEVESLKDYGMHYRKLLEYAYDPLSGKVNEVVYQRGKPDAMYHRYKYDEDLRLTEVWTSRDGQYWENDARYRYYLHGPLKRKETGKWHLQGEDYAYTINGWMKGLNAWKRDSTLDMGRDGLAGGPNEWYGTDVLGYEVKYFEGDYQGVGPGGFQRSDTLTVAGLYNGNIAGSSIDQWGLDHLQRRYRYDVLNRLQAFEGLDGSGNLKSDWNTSYRYDKDGNILRLMRMGPNGLMDSLTYHYLPGKDQLQYVDDGVAAGLYSNDIDDQAPGNYAYDKVGNLIEDKQAKMLIRWTDYGKVKEIDTLIQGNPSAILPKLTFRYDATGNRLEKEYAGHYKDIYLRDPQGNVMAVYRIRKDSLFLTELPMYGEKRFGVIKENCLLMKKPTQNSIVTPVIVTASKPPAKTSTYPLGKKHYETTDWLGNVRVTYTDKKSWNNGKFALNVSSSQDYYPFGSVMEGRDFEFTNYRFGFQGQEGDDEVYGKNNLWAYKYRLHDARLGRFFSVDPLADKYPFYSFYQFSGNRLIDKVELEGLEPGEPGTEENQLETAPVEGNEEGPEHVWLWQNNKWVDYGQKMPEVEIVENRNHESNENENNKMNSINNFPYIDAINKQDKSNIYDTRSISFKFHQFAYLPVEGIGVHGSYHVKGGISFSQINERIVATISAVGITTAGNYGNVDFQGEASLIVNGKVKSIQTLSLSQLYIFESGTYPIGSTSFLLPRTGSVSIKLQVGYSFQGPEGRATPTPSTLSRMITIPVLNSNSDQYVAPK